MLGSTANCSTADMIELTATHSRPLSAVEREVVLRELQADARGVRIVGYGLALAALTFGAFTFGIAGRGEWLLALGCGTLSATTAWMSRVTLGKRTYGAPELTVFRAVLRCETRRTPKDAHLYVGPFRVLLRSGWLEFWPEGQVVRVELCLPLTSQGTTWAAAVVVSLPGIDIQSWRDQPPPNARIWLMVVALLSGIFTLVAGAIVIAGDMWRPSLTGTFSSDQVLVFEDVQALNAEAEAWSSTVTIRHAHRVRMIHGDNYLCKLAQPSELVVDNAEIAPVNLPFEGESDAAVAELCAIEEREARLDALVGLAENSEPGAGATLLKLCRERAQQAADAKHFAKRRAEVADFMWYGIHSDPANTCVRAHFADDAPIGATALEDEVGVLDTEKVWHSGTQAVNLMPFVWVGLCAILTACSWIWQSTHRTQYLVKLAAWKQRIRQHA